MSASSPPPPRRRFGTGGSRRSRAGGDGSSSGSLLRVAAAGSVVDSQVAPPEASAEFGSPSAGEITTSGSFHGGGGMRGGAPTAAATTSGLNDLEALLSRADMDEDGAVLRTPTPPPSLPAATSFRRGDASAAGEEFSNGPASPIVPRQRGPHPAAPSASSHQDDHHTTGDMEPTLSNGAATPRGHASSAVRSLRSTPRRTASGTNMRLATPPQPVLDAPAVHCDDDDIDHNDHHAQPASFSGATSRDASAANTPAAGSPLSARKRTTSSESSPSRQLARPSIPTNDDRNGNNLDVPHDMRCPVCLDAFNDPVTLSCYHNVCQAHVRDLAATRGRKSGDDPAAIVLECPKCRQPTSFADARSIRVNTEMKAIVDMMLMMLRANQAQQQQQQSVSSAEGTPTKSAPTSAIHTPRPKSSGRAGDPKTPASRGGSGAGGRPPRVRFAEDVGPDGDDAAPSSARPSNNNNNSSRRTPRSEGDDGDGAATATAPPVEQQPPGHRQAKKLADLEKQLEAKRQQMIAERDKRNREATEMFKRQRMEEIRSRQAVVASVDASNDPLLRKPLALRMAAGERIAESERPLTDTERQFRAQEAAFVAAKRERDKAKEQEREAREKEVRDALQDWLNEGEDGGVRGSLTTEQETQEFAARMQLVAGARPLTESVRRDVMREVAEQRLPPMPEPRPVVPEVPPTPPPEPFRDIEVELRLLESERDVQREVDDELSRAEMAAIAERRARQSVDSFRRQEQRNRPWSRGAVGAYEPTPLASSDAGGIGYKPKLSRLRRIM